MELVKKLFEPVDMTEGSPWKKIVLFTLPMLVGNIAQQLYNTVDSVVVGNYVGDNALAAVGSAGPILNLLIVLFVGISVGAGIMVSQYFGAREREELSLTIGNCITLTLIASLFVMVVASLVARPLLELLDTPESIIDWCQSYLTVTFVGIAGLAYYNILGGVLRGLGDSISALLYLLIATVINIVLDVWFVAGLGLGVMGVALATIIAQAPKMRPHIDAMRANIANALRIEPAQVNVKATTEEGLGFTGTGEGISAQAVCLLTSPAELYDRDVTKQGDCASCPGCKGER